MSPTELADLDRQHLWHPFTQQQSWQEEDFPIIERADDTTLYDTEGNAYIDGVSSLWCNVHGHRHPAIDIAIKDQLDRVAHSTMLGLSHAPAAKLAKRLVDLAPDGLSRVFFSDNGSTACERPSMVECATRSSWSLMAMSMAGWRWPCTLHHSEETPSM